MTVRVRLAFANIYFSKDSIAIVTRLAGNENTTAPYLGAVVPDVSFLCDYTTGQSQPKVPAVTSAYTSPSNTFFIVVLHGRAYQIDSCSAPRP